MRRITPDLCAINTATFGFRDPLDRSIDAIARAGFGGLSVWRRELEGQNMAALAKRIRDANLALLSTCRSTFIPAETSAQFNANIADNVQAIAEAGALGAKCLVLVTGSLRDLPQARSMVRDGIGLLMDHATQHGVKLALEPMHPVYAHDRSCITSIREALTVCEYLDPAAETLGLMLDVYHIWWDASIAASVAACQGRILGFHINDWLEPVTDVLTNRGMMGDGVIDIPGIRTLVEAAGYDGLVEVEIFSKDTWWKRPVTETLAVIKERLVTAV
jgi:sugar phosphate isomerase/epimerase